MGAIVPNKKERKHVASKILLCCSHARCKVHKFSPLGIQIEGIKLEDANVTFHKTYHAYERKLNTFFRL